MADKKTTKILIRRKKFIEVDLPITKSKFELIGNSVEEINGKTIKLDLTRQLKGKSVEAVVKIKLEKNKAVAYPEKIKLMPYFIRRMIRKRISYVEDSFKLKSQESELIIKPFLITRKRVSRVVRKTLRNKTKNWLEDYISQKKDSDVFTEILSNKMQKNLSLILKKTYPLSLCEIRALEIKRVLNPEEVPKIKKIIKEEYEEKEDVIDQLKELEDEKIKNAENEIKETQDKASKLEENNENLEENNKDLDNKESKKEKPKKPSKKKVENTSE